MNTVRAAAVRVMPPATDKAKRCVPHHDKKVAK
jgi:hypothetical protein